MHLNLFFTVLIILSPSRHPFHVSVTDINHNPETQSVQISHRIFLDDLETGLKQHFALEKLDTYQPEDPQKLDSLLGEYLKSKVFFSINGTKRDFNYIGSEPEGNARWCYYEIDGVAEINEVTITNAILMEVFEDQQNIVYFRLKGKIKRHKLDKEEKSIHFSF